MKTTDTIRKFLVDYIEQRGIKQAFIADSIGVKRTVLSSMLNGKRKIQADEFFSICRAVDMPQETINSLISKLTERK